MTTRWIAFDLNSHVGSKKRHGMQSESQSNGISMKPHVAQFRILMTNHSITMKPQTFLVRIYMKALRVSMEPRTVWPDFIWLLIESPWNVNCFLSEYALRLFGISMEPRTVLARIRMKAQRTAEEPRMSQVRIHMMTNRIGTEPQNWQKLFSIR